MPTIREIREKYPQYADLSDSELADRLHSRFYSDIPRAEFNAKIGLPPAPPGITGEPQTVKKASTLDPGGVVNGIAEMLTFNLDDEIAAGLQTGGGMWGDYGKTLEQFRKEKGEIRERAPVSNLVGNLAGAAVIPARAISAATTLPQAIGRGIATGGITGLLYGAGEGEGIPDRLDKAVTGGVVGGTVGAVVAPAVRAIGRRGARKRAQANIPSRDELRTTAKRAYDTAERSGVQVAQQSYANTTTAIAQKVASEGIDPTLHPKATAALKRLTETQGTTPTIKEMDTLRKVLADVMRSNEPSERRLAGIMIDQFDDFIDNLKPSDLVAGAQNAADAASALRVARTNWKRLRKAETVQQMLDKAENSSNQYSVSGIENALRSQFRQLANNPKRMRVFSKEEQAAIRNVARGGPMRNLARFVGKFAPRGVISTVLASQFGAATMGPGGVALPLVGEAGRRVANRMTRDAVQNVDDMVRAGQPIENLIRQQQLPDRASRPVTNAITQEYLKRGPTIPASSGLIGLTR